MKFINKIIFCLIIHIPKSIIRLVAKKYVAGQTITEAINIIKKLNDKNIIATVDILGENVNNKAEAKEAVELYRELLTRINENRLNATISLKPTHLGLKLDKEFCYKNIYSIVQFAAKFNNCICIDMENSTCTSDTIEIYNKLKNICNNVGIALQSRLRRTLSDVNDLITSRGNIRLCKGVYLESPEVAFQNMDDINNNYVICLDKLLSNKCYVCIATHDEKLIRKAFEIIDRLGLKKDEYEFQALLGVKESLWDIIIKRGHRLRIYVPFGEQWYEYSMRRLGENPSLIKYIIKQLI